MDRASARASTLRPVVFRDGLGQRHRIVDTAGIEKLEVLCLRGELATAGSFEPTLRERVEQLAGLRHECFARVRRVDRLSDQAATLVLVSEPTPGVRLSDLLATAERHGLALDSRAGWCLIRQVVSAVAMFHQQAPDIAHGAIAPERIIVTPTARPVIVEHVLGSALERLRFSHERYWTELRIACPRSAGPPQLGHRADVVQVGVVAVSLILGRPLGDDEYPSRLEEMVESGWAISASGDTGPMPPQVRSWLARALQFDRRNSFSSAIEASAELGGMIDQSDDILAHSALEAFLARYRECVGRPVAAEPARPNATPTRLDPPPISLVAPVSPAADPPAPPRRTDPAGSKPPSLHVLVEPRSETKAVGPQPDAVHAAGAADEEGQAQTTKRAHTRRWRPTAVATILVTVLTGVGGVAAHRRFVVSAERVSTGTLAISTNPPGAQVVVDGEPRGTTPVSLAVKAGAHAVDLRGAGEPRRLSLTVAAGAVVSQYLELPKGGPAVGQLHVRTEPAGASVTVDGVHRGTSPVTITDLSAGEHAVVLENQLGLTKQTVTIEPGAAASIIAQLAAPQSAPLSGWITVSAPNDVLLYENGSLIGSSQSDRIMVSAGMHQLEIVSEALGYRSVRAVQVTGGKVSAVKVDFPKVTIAVNAIPWAVVWIDGEKIGETPIGNLPVTLGSHEVIFRNPELGEQRQVATVTLTSPTRLSVDLRKK